MKRLRTASSPRLLAFVAVLVAVVAGAGIAQAALTGAQKPAPKALDRASSTPSTLPPSQGVSARIEFTNNLLPSGSLPRDTASPTLTGATGRLWLADDGRLRLELQSANGDAQIVSDGKRSCSTTRRRRRPSRARSPGRAPAPAAESEPATLAGVREGLAKLGQMWQLSGAHPERDRQPPELHRADRAQGRRRPARRGRARLGRRARRAAARRDLRPGLAGPGARAEGDRGLLRRDRGLEVRGRRRPRARRSPRSTRRPASTSRASRCT